MDRKEGGQGGETGRGAMGRERLGWGNGEGQKGWQGPRVGRVRRGGWTGRRGKM